MEFERILRSQGFGSRPECRALICSGRVSIDGKCCDNPYEDFAIDRFKFSVDGVEWRYRKHVYLALNKPRDCECSHKPKHHPSVYTLLPRHFVTRGVQAVGRLDEDTTGLLLMTDDGQFIHTYTSPKKLIPKVYLVTTKHGVDDAQVSALLAGVTLNDDPVPVRATACERVDDRVLRLTVTEGKYHLVKRMIAATSNRVDALHRVSVGGFGLPSSLAEGQWIWLEEADLERLATGKMDS
jgi:16S rRNA pseudouridine516 synthase